MNFYDFMDSDTFVSLVTIFIFVLIYLISFIKKVPSGTVYIIDRNTHYHKTVKRGFFLFNKKTDKITTEISLKPKTKRYYNFFETEDGKICSVDFNVTYSALDVEDVLYNLSATRRSIDDVILSSMYHAVLSLKQKDINSTSLEQEFQRNLYSQVLSLCINIHEYHLVRYANVSNNVYGKNVFKPHKSRSLSGYVDYNNPSNSKYQK